MVNEILYIYILVWKLNYETYFMGICEISIYSLVYVV